MANISSAFGAITIYAHNKNAIENYFKLLKTLEYGCYDTYIEDDFDPEYLQQDEVENYLKYQTSFDGDGRWVYQCNVEYSHNWILSDVKSRHPELQSLVDELVNEEFKVTYDFTDYEPGCQIFYSQEITVQHEAGKPFDEVSFIEGNCEDHEINIVNFCNILGYSLNEAVEEWHWDHDDSVEDYSETKAQLLEEKENIMNCFHESVDDLIAEYGM